MKHTSESDGEKIIHSIGILAHLMRRSTAQHAQHSNVDTWKGAYANE